MPLAIATTASDHLPKRRARPANGTLGLPIRGQSQPSSYSLPGAPITRSCGSLRLRATAAQSHSDGIPRRPQAGFAALPQRLCSPSVWARRHGPAAPTPQPRLVQAPEIAHGSQHVLAMCHQLGAAGTICPIPTVALGRLMGTRSSGTAPCFSAHPIATQILLRVPNGPCLPCLPGQIPLQTRRNNRLNRAKHPVRPHTVTCHTHVSHTRDAPPESAHEPFNPSVSGRIAVLWQALPCRAVSAMVLGAGRAILESCARKIDRASDMYRVQLYTSYRRSA